MKTLLTITLTLIIGITLSQTTPEFIKVEGGTFTMGDVLGLGDEDEQPPHEVTVSTFSITKTEITVAQYREYCNSTGVSMPETPSWGWYGNNPIVNVSWHDAIGYADWLSDKLDMNIRLPYEAEWEYAARGGSKSKGYKCSGANSAGNAGWYEANSGGKPHNVATKKANEMGLYDMSGNVYEWCMDKYDGNYYSSSPKNNPRGPSTGANRVRRGGSWHSNAPYCRSANRFNISPDYRHYLMGFRLVAPQ